MGNLNLFMPAGHARYQPKSLAQHFGYDFAYYGLACVEFANLEVLGDLGVIPPTSMQHLTPEIREQILGIPATTVDKTEREITGHDVRAWIHEAQRILNPELGRWLHLLLTSYDSLDTGRILQYVTAHQQVVRPKTVSIIKIMADLVEKHAGQLQIGRTHGQHALPITVGFWLATILSRMVYNFTQMDINANALTGKVSGAVGAYNAQAGLGISALCAGGLTFEERVLAKVGLKPAPISTQILPLEPLAYYLHACMWLSQAYGQLGTDGRNLMRSEIAEIAEASTVAVQVGSSTMAGKINPFKFEGLVGEAINTEVDYHRVPRVGISEHQRDLVGSRPSRRFPEIIISLVTQEDELLRAKEDEEPFLTRLIVKPENCQRNFDQSAHMITGEPLYIALQMAGYEGDAHDLVNKVIAPLARMSHRNLIEELEDFADRDSDFEYLDSVRKALDMMPSEVKELLHHPEQYVGCAQEKAQQIADNAREVVHDRS